MTNWIRSLQPSGSPDDLGPIQLAWLGDAVWEMHQRLRLCQKPARAKDLHDLVVTKVKAEAQAEALSSLEIHLTEIERNFVKRGRNRVCRGSRKINIAIYGKATGFETLIGWLFLKNPIRLAQLLDQLDAIQSDKPLLK
ncbi:Mini-ribonuclease 3 [Prochlorococcus marinus]|uniref:Mini-ribonuclease 3 n=1 Tax=Prochlorococcus marinus TaxID=1219 RepID=UPI0022B3D139|nr:ribonuclease III domain-containing protein [Prochlorococcus marinus]